MYGKNLLEPTTSRILANHHKDSAWGFMSPLLFFNEETWWLCLFSTFLCHYIWIYVIYGSWQLNQLTSDPRDQLHILRICSNTLHTQRVHVLAGIFHEGLNSQSVTHNSLLCLMHYKGYTFFPPMGISKTIKIDRLVHLLSIQCSLWNFYIDFHPWKSLLWLITVFPVLLWILC